MTLGELLAARADNARAREVVEIGALGSIALEALPVQDLERLSRGADADRAVFYAASRELQSVGAALLRAGKVSRPDQVMAFVSDEEAAKAAGAVRALSGGQDSHEEKVRLDGVQKNEVRHESVQKAEVRLDAVRTKSMDFDEIRLPSVQLEMGRGQVSREFLTESDESGVTEGKTQVLRGEMTDEPQNVGISDSSGGSLQNAERGNSTRSLDVGSGRGRGLHETESELGALLHETKSELGTERREELHEIESEFGTKSGEGLHEIKSESGESERDDMPIYRHFLHETESERGAERREKLHESESELTERVARGILEGLRRAAWVR